VVRRVSANVAVLRRSTVPIEIASLDGETAAFVRAAAGATGGGHIVVWRG
jgi:hypothetical protein